MAKKKPAEAESPFVAWIRAVGTAEVARRLKVSEQTVRNWRKGAGVKPSRIREVQAVAMEDGVPLSTEHLLGTAP